ncbi:QcrA and Rieske domain-containing protein [Occultella gossypii]|uniref:Cytochrome bc1 complex Rieske iron-sulfur subunit n=1 Tax=Occultella gossypii TaxID=2800820 RepID=A0ABS7SDR2_9MICO|nr:Rieske (2Fe-2S) protein [Occultella gossypii]MBZ2198481.1 Rieske 2Fe-2S domain-containing protein [Occultella gossypii]
MCPCPSRRQVLLASGGGVTLAGLAACSAQPEVEEPTAGETLVALADVPVGGSLVVTTADGVELVVAQPTEGEVVAFSAICTHQGCSVRVREELLHCPCHGSEFEQFTGEVVSGPADEPLPEVAVQVQEGNVVTA